MVNMVLKILAVTAILSGCGKPELRGGVDTATLCSTNDPESEACKKIIEESKKDEESVESGESDGLIKTSLDNCIDPDLSQLTFGVVITLCDGTVGEGTLNECDAAGKTDCIVSDVWRSYDPTKISKSQIVAGQTVAGVLGEAPLAPAACAENGSIDCIANAEFKAADMSVFQDSDIRSGITVAGISGTLADCSAGGSTGCVTTATHKSVVISGLAAKVKNTVVVAGETGTYPSSGNLLAGADSTNDLSNNAGSRDAQLKLVTNFEFFMPDGTRVVGQGDADLATASNVASGVTIFGTLGTLAGGPSCSSDGETSCVTTSRYKAMDTDASVISTWDIRKGKTAGGIAGEITFYKNMADTSLFNRTTGTGALAGLDIFDTIDDYNNNSTFPTQNPGGWDQATGANWLRDSASDNGDGGGTVGDGICNGTEDCVQQDRITGLVWAQADATTRTWETAITYCDGLNYGTYTNWRLPTQKELMQAYTDGVWSQKDATKLNLAASYFWSSTTQSLGTTTAWATYLYNGITYNYSKTSNWSVLCVAP